MIKQTENELNYFQHCAIALITLIIVTAQATILDIFNEELITS